VEEGMAFTGSSDKVQAVKRKAEITVKTAKNAAKEVKCGKKPVKGYFLVFLSE
jgi:hypothetical protein